MGALFDVEDLTGIGDFARDGGGGDHEGGHEDGASGRATLAPFEVAITGTRAKLVTDEFVGVHAEAHRATRPTPFKAGITVNLCQAHAFGEAGYALGAGNHDRFHAAADFAAFDVACHFLQVAQSSIRAASKEGHLDLGALDGFACGELHVDESLLCCGTIFFWHIGSERNVFVNEDRLAGIDAPSDCRSNIRRIVSDDIIVNGIWVGCGGLPSSHGGIPIRALGSIVAALQILESGIVGIHVSHTGPTLDGHVTNGHAFFLREGVECGAAVFVSVAETAVDSELTNNVKDHVLRINTGAQLAIHIDATDLGFADRHRLRGEHVTDLAGSDAESDSAEGAVGGRVGITAGNRVARLSDPLLRADDVNDALLTARKIEKLDPMIVAIFPKRLDHSIRKSITEWLVALVGRNDVVYGCKGAGRVENLQTQIPQHSECLWAGDLVDEVRAD